MIRRLFRRLWFIIRALPLVRTLGWRAVFIGGIPMTPESERITRLAKQAIREHVDPWALRGNIERIPDDKLP